MSDANQAKTRRCPHLGIESDQYTAYSYPSPNHHCALTPPGTSIKQEYQLQYCLSKRHPQCSVFVNGNASTLPPEAKAEKQSFLGSSPNAYLVLISLLALLLLVSGFLILIASQFS